MKISILMYHAILKDNERPKDPYQINWQQFIQQINYIKEKGYQVINIEEIGKVPIQKDAENFIMLTFDDGDISGYEIVEPILRQYRFKAHFFITVGKIGNNGAMNWKQIKFLRDKEQIIGSHGMTHRILTSLSDKEIEQELKTSKKILEDNLGIPIKYLSIPRGFYNKKIIVKAKEFGYQAVFTSILGVNTNSNFDLFRLCRIPIKKSLSIDRFVRILHGGHLIKEKTKETLKKTTQVLLGIKNYEKITLRAYK